MTPIRIATLYADLAERMESLRNDHSIINRSRALVENALEDGSLHYGINTGFGILANIRINKAQRAELQKNLLLSHACGVGEPVLPEITRLMMQLKIHALALGYSGISVKTFRQLLALEQSGLTPWVPSRGSLGASGDLAPLAHMCLPLIGRGNVWTEDFSAKTKALPVLVELGIEPIELQPKDGVSLINGTQLMSAHGAYILERTLVLQKQADILAAMSLEALQGSCAPFDARVHEIRPHPGQGQVAANIRQMLTDSEILDAHRDCGKVQDPYCLRCVPQVHGASRDAIAHCISVVETEMNSVTDNPLVFPGGDIISGGNFHGQPLALALDFAAIALSELASISERRIYLLLEGHDGLPALLMEDTGVNSGFMIPQYTAAALVSENKILSHPASVDSIPSSLGQEDHVSMGAISAMKLLSILRNVEHVLAAELLCATQALDFRAPMKPGAGVLDAHRFVRERIVHANRDYEVGDDLDLCASMLRRGELAQAVESGSGSLH